MNESRRRAFEELFVEHRRTLLAFFLRRVEQGADAADLLSEVYLVAWRRMDDVPEGDEARLWLFGVAHRVLANHRRGGRRRLGLAPELARAVERATPDASAGFESREALASVRVALGALEAMDRDILTLHAWEGLTSAEVARVTGVPQSTVRVRLHRARKRLRASLANADDVEPPAATG